MNSEAPILIYRILHIENVELLTTRGGLHAPSKAPNDGLVYRVIHSQAIQSQRGGRRVPCGPGGSIQDYVSFYFGCRGPMLLQIATGRVPGVDEDQNRVVYAVSSVESIQAYGLPFVFTDGHSLANFTAWFETLEDLTALDWDTIGARMWHDTLGEP